MKQRNSIIGIASAMTILILILDSKSAFSGISDGLDICIKTLIPSLFPFLLFSNLLTSALSGQPLRLLRPLANILHLPMGSESIVGIGFVGGYPVGAQCVGHLYQQGQVTSQQAERMIVVCNQAGPAFIFGVLGSMFSKWYIPWFLWCVQIVSALLTGILLRNNSTTESLHPRTCPTTISGALEKAVKIMALVCAWVMLMRMAITFLERWCFWLIPIPMQAIICGILELSNGCIQLAQLENEGLRFILGSGMLSLGGLCVALQTHSVTTGISKKIYFPGKLLQCSISLLICCIIQPMLYPSLNCNSHYIAVIACILGIISVFTLHLSKNNSRISALSGV